MGETFHFDTVNLMYIKNNFQGGKKLCNCFSFVNNEVYYYLIPSIILLYLVLALPSQGDPSKDNITNSCTRLGHDHYILIQIPIAC
jgi:hypothetical protein